jgi:hypothetical protein
MTLIDIQTATDAPRGGWKPNTQAGTMRTDLSREWLSRPADQKYLDLTSLHAALKTRFEGSETHTMKNSELKVGHPEIKTKADTHKLTVEVAGREVYPTNWAFGQMAELVKAPASYLRRLPSPIVADAINYDLRFTRGVEAVKTFSGEFDLQAVTGPDYGRIADYLGIEAVMNVAGNGVGESKWKVPGTLDWSTGIYDPRTPVTLNSTTLFASDRDYFVFLVDDLHPIEIGKLPNGEPDYVFRGFYVKGSEVGRTAQVIATFYLRAVCCNRIMWGVEHFEDIRIVHSKYAPDRFMEMAAPALESFSNGSSATLIEGVEKAKAAQAAKDDDEMIAFLQARDFNKKTSKLILEAVEREEGHPARSIWDVAQGITAVARTIPNNDDRVDMELTAGKLLDKVAA